MASSATLSVADVINFWSNEESILDSTQPQIDIINSKLRNPEMKAWIDAGCTTDIYGTLHQVIRDQQIRPIRMVNTSTNKYTTVKANVKTAKAILTKGLSVVYEGKVYPTSHVDLQIELDTINQSVEQKALPLIQDKIQDKINPVPQNPLTILQAKDIYQAIADGELYYGKTAIDNTIGVPRDELAEEFKLNLDCSKTELIGPGTVSKTFKVWDIQKCKYFAIKQKRINGPFEEHELQISDLLRAVGEELDETLVKQYGYHYDRENKYGFIIMEYIDHDIELTNLLRQVENNYNPLPPQISPQIIDVTQKLYSTLSIKDIENITFQLANALQALHAAGIVHRNLKPTKVMLLSTSKKPDEDEGSNKTKDQTLHRVKLFDFGLGKVMASRSDDDKRDFLTHTNIGNAPAKAPELGGADGYNARLTDLFGLGMTILHLIFGYIPGFYHGCVGKGMRPIASEEELKQQRIKMPTITNYMREFEDFVRDVGLKQKPDMYQALKKRRDEIWSDEWVDFRQALNYLINVSVPTYREFVFGSKFITEYNKAQSCVTLNTDKS